MTNLFKILEWDSSFFGYSVGKIIASEINSDRLAEIIKEAENNKTRLIYLFTEPGDKQSNLAAFNCNAKLVDKKITFHKKIDPADSSETDNHIEQYNLNLPSDQLVNLSLQSGLYSRYKIDTEFRNHEFEKLYRAWIDNSVNKKIADYTFLYKENNLELGFVTLKLKEGYGEIGLIAVDENARGKAIGSKLIAAVINQLIDKNITDLHVATQLENTLACNFYKKAGFSGIKTEYIYHIWL